MDIRTRKRRAARRPVPPGPAATVNMASPACGAACRWCPTLANITAGNWSYQPIAGILHDPARRRQHVGAIVALVHQQKYAGIDIDYEKLRAGDRQAFTEFVRELAEALHARQGAVGRGVPQGDQRGLIPRNIAQDYAAIGGAADQVRIMGYNYHWATSGARRGRHRSAGSAR